MPGAATGWSPCSCWLLHPGCGAGSCWACAGWTSISRAGAVRSANAATHGCGVVLRAAEDALLDSSPDAVRALERQRWRQAKERLAAGELWEDQGLVFGSTIGTPMEPRNVNRRCEQLRDAAGLGWLHLHDLRHAFATFLLDQGEEWRTVMELLGHSTIRLTADTYGHVLPARARQAASAIDRALGEGSVGALAVRMAVPVPWLRKCLCWWSPGDSNP